MSAPDAITPPAETTPDRSLWLRFGAAGLALGLAHADARLGGLAWVGIAGLAAALAQPQRLRWVVGGLALLGTLDLWVGHSWQALTAWLYSGGRYGLSLVMMLAFTAVNLMPKLLPVALAYRVLGPCRVPVAAWLPAAWLLGEWLRDWLTGMTYHDWLITQSQLTPVLKAVGHLGWTWAALICLTAAALWGEAAWRRSWRWAVPGGFLMAGIALLPSLPKAPEALLAGVGAVHMNSYASPPQSCPPAIRLLVWPEQTRNSLPRLKEGPGRGKRIEPPFASRGVGHIYGLITRTLAGYQNSLLSLASDGTVIRSRAKAHLFPFSETPALGVSAFVQMPLVAGHASARLPTPVGSVVSLICLEGLLRDYIRAEVDATTRLITISANEALFQGSEVAMRQFVDVAVLLAVENHRPVVRASLYGTAAIVDQDGTVMAVSEPGADGVLTTKADQSGRKAE